MVNELLLSPPVGDFCLQERLDTDREYKQRRTIGEVKEDLVGMASLSVSEYANEPY